MTLIFSLTKLRILAYSCTSSISYKYNTMIIQQNLRTINLLYLLYYINNVTTNRRNR